MKPFQAWNHSLKSHLLGQSYKAAVINWRWQYAYNVRKVSIRQVLVQCL